MKVENEMCRCCESVALSNSREQRTGLLRLRLAMMQMVNKWSVK